MSQRSELPPYDDELLPDGIRSRFVDNINGLRMHVLEAGYEDNSRPGVLLLHGFPELTFSWRRRIDPSPPFGLQFDKGASLMHT